MFLTKLKLPFYLAFLVLFQTTAWAKLNIVTTTAMIADAIINIAPQDGSVTVNSLMGTGVDPHLYRPTSGDIQSLSKADIIFFNGLYLEGRMDEIFHKMARNRSVYAVGESLDKNLLIKADQYVYDPHIWMDVKLWSKVVNFIYQKLLIHIPREQHSTITKNYNIYNKKLEKLNAQITKKMTAIPKNKRVLVTAHDAFAYFGRQYQVEVIGLQGISTADEFSIKDMIKIQNLIIEKKVKSVFLESSVTPKFIQSLKKGLQAKNYPVLLGGELFSDAMGMPGTIEGTYLGMMNHNATTIYFGLK